MRIEPISLYTGGVGTLISTLGAGAIMQLIYSALRFEPRKIRQRPIGEIVKILTR